LWYISGMTQAQGDLQGTGQEIRTTLLDPLQMLDSRERIFAEHIANGNTQVNAARAAGFKQPEKLAYRVLKRPHVARAVKYIADENRKAAGMDRKKVMAGFLDAIDIAKLQADGSTMVAGWREVGRMCGLYEPEKKELAVSVTAKRMIEKLETMTTEELFELQAESDAVEAEFEELPSP
jgi:hypothetical protein